MECVCAGCSQALIVNIWQYFETTIENQKEVWSILESNSLNIEHTKGRGQSDDTDVGKHVLLKRHLCRRVRSDSVWPRIRTSQLQTFLNTVQTSKVHCWQSLHCLSKYCIFKMDAFSWIEVFCNGSERL
jgi:hypothetical protein